MPSSPLEDGNGAAQTDRVDTKENSSPLQDRTSLPEPFSRIRTSTFLAGSTAEGPWSPKVCHGGGPSALIAQVAEAVPAAAEMCVARVTVDLMRPVPTGELDVEARVLREGKKLQLVDVKVSAAGVVVTRGSVLRLRREDQDLGQVLPQLNFPSADKGAPTRPPTGVGFSQLFEMRAAAGSFEALGPAAIWFNMTRPLIAGESTSPCARSVACADFANGIASVLPFSSWSYPSTDLTVSFIREPVGAEILVDAECWAGGQGRGITHARLGDALGWFGRSMQTAIFERRHS